MAKKLVRKLKVTVAGGKATPAPPLGPTLGQAKVNIGEFVTKFNAATKDMAGDMVPVVISVYEDRTFDFVVKTPPASNLILKVIGKEKGSGKNVSNKVGTIKKDQIRAIAERKLKDLNANDLEAASKIIEGTARSMGVEIRS
ncbi:MAG: 50S ribosomal protein L11 [Parcubacteria group bacterium GW2011_GWA2_47_21]|nr:MAG: 50S ribosomal protein L11 [Parcubacteria group bacterium GW2011_GWA2_47_21]